MVIGYSALPWIAGVAAAVGKLTKWYRRDQLEMDLGAHECCAMRQRGIKIDEIDCCERLFAQYRSIKAS